MRFLLRAVSRHQGKDSFLASTKGIAKAVGARVAHPRWTSYGALEVDVFVPSDSDFRLLTAALEPLAEVEFGRNLDDPPPYRSKEATLAEAVRYFDAERFWECHEALEPVWREAKGEERRLVQALILVCAALVHEQRGERDVALGIYRRALPQIAWGDRTYVGIDVASLRRNVERSLASGDVAPFRI